MSEKPVFQYPKVFNLNTDSVQKDLEALYGNDGTKGSGLVKGSNHHQGSQDNHRVSHNVSPSARQPGK